MAFAPWYLTMSSKNDCMSAGSQPKPVSVKRVLPFWNIQARATPSLNSPILTPYVPGNLVLNWAARVISESQVQVSVKRVLPFWNIQARATPSLNSPILTPYVPGNLVLNWAARVISESQVQV